MTLKQFFSVGRRNSGRHYYLSLSLDWPSQMASHGPVCSRGRSFGLLSRSMAAPSPNGSWPSSAPFILPQNSTGIPALNPQPPALNP